MMSTLRAEHDLYIMEDPQESEGVNIEFVNQFLERYQAHPLNKQAAFRVFLPRLHFLAGESILDCHSHGTEQSSYVLCTITPNNSFCSWFRHCRQSAYYAKILEDKSHCFIVVFVGFQSRAAAKLVCPSEFDHKQNIIFSPGWKRDGISWDRLQRALPFITTIPDCLSSFGCAERSQLEPLLLHSRNDPLVGGFVDDQISSMDVCLSFPVTLSLTSGTSLSLCDTSLPVNHRLSFDDSVLFLAPSGHIYSYSNPKLNLLVSRLLPELVEQWLKDYIPRSAIAADPCVVPDRSSDCVISPNYTESEDCRVSNTDPSCEKLLIIDKTVPGAQHTRNTITIPLKDGQIKVQVNSGLSGIVSIAVGPDETVICISQTTNRQKTMSHSERMTAANIEPDQLNDANQNGCKLPCLDSSAALDSASVANTDSKVVSNPDAKPPRYVADLEPRLPHSGQVDDRFDDNSTDSVGEQTSPDRSCRDIKTDEKSGHITRSSVSSSPIVKIKSNSGRKSRIPIPITHKKSTVSPTTLDPNTFAGLQHAISTLDKRFEQMTDLMSRNHDSVMQFITATNKQGQIKRDELQFENCRLRCRLKIAERKLSRYEESGRNSATSELGHSAVVQQLTVQDGNDISQTTSILGTTHETSSGLAKATTTLPKEEVRILTPPSSTMTQQSIVTQRSNAKYKTSSFRSQKPHNLPLHCPHLVLGDSILKNVSGRQIDTKGNVLVKVLPGAKIEDVTEYINQQSIRTACASVTLLVGSNNCCNPKADMQDIKSCLKDLIITNQKKFPNAKIKLHSPPTRLGKFGLLWNKNICAFNSFVQEKCQSSELIHINCQRLATRGMYRDNVHLSDQGTTELIKCIKDHLRHDLKTTSRLPMP